MVRISQAIGDDHKLIDSYHDKLVEASSLDEKVQWRNQLTWALARHAISEELTMYPAMEKHMGQEGLDLTNVDRAQHQAVGFFSPVPDIFKYSQPHQVKEDLYKLQSMSPSDSAFDALLQQLMTDLHNHIEHESNEDMPRLEKLLSEEESQALAESFDRTKMITPTRSHPSAPNRPIWENLAALMAAPVDRIGDMMRSWPEESKL